MDQIGKLKFCKGCLFILQNSKNISENPELDKTIKTYINLKKESKEVEELIENCNFCFGILSLSNELKIFKVVETLTQIYDFNDYKLTTNFSPLFQLLHSYVCKLFYKLD